MHRPRGPRVGCECGTECMKNLEVFCKFYAKHAYLSSLEVDNARVKNQIDINKAIIQELDVLAVMIDSLTVRKLDVTGLCDLENVNVAGELQVTGPLALASDLDVGGKAAVAGDLSVGGNAAVSTLTATGESDLQDVKVAGELQVSGAVALTNDLDVGGQAAVTGDLSVGGNADITGSLTVSDDVQLDGYQVTVDKQLNVLGGVVLGTTSPLISGFIIDNSFTTNPGNFIQLTESNTLVFGDPGANPDLTAINAYSANFLEFMAQPLQGQQVSGGATATFNFKFAVSQCPLGKIPRMTGITGSLFNDTTNQDESNNPIGWAATSYFGNLKFEPEADFLTSGKVLFNIQCCRNMDWLDRYQCGFHIAWVWVDPNV